MRLSRATLAAAAVAAVSLSVPSAHAEFEAGISGGISVGGDLSACASLKAPSLAAGAFTASGVLLPVDRIDASGEMVLRPSVVPVARAQPVVTSSTGSWSGCLGGYLNLPPTGHVVFTLTATSGGGEFVDTKVCSVSHTLVYCS